MIAFLFLLATLRTSAPQLPVSLSPVGPALWAGLTPGPNHVGYRRVDTHGAVIHLWYPATGSGGRLRFKDYLADGATALAGFLGKAGVDSAAISRLFASPLYAVRGAAAIDSAFPLVLVAQGNGEDLIDQVVLCEYLASLGFVVATTPSPTLKTPLEREDQVGSMADAQAAELKSAIGVAASVVRVNLAQIGLVGHSFGARAALLLAMQDSRIRALVSLDGGIGTAMASAEFEKAPSFRIDARLPPILHFYETLDSFMSPDFGLLHRLHTDSLEIVPTSDLHHIHFTTYGFVARDFPAIAKLTHATPATGPAAVGVARQTGAFLQRSLHQPR